MSIRVVFSIYNTEFSFKLLSIDAFRERVSSLYVEKMLPELEKIMGMGRQDSNQTDSFDRKKDISYVRKSAQINSLLWYEEQSIDFEFEKLYNFIKKRILSMDDVFSVSTNEVRLIGKIYNDVFPSNWFYEEVANATKAGYLNGVGKGFFDPYANVKRSEIAQVLFNITNPVNVVNKYLFLDVKESDWYYKAIAWVSDNGLMDEISPGMFFPEKYSTREEVVLSIYRLKKPKEIDNKSLENFSDSSEISSAAKPALEWAVSNEIIFGSNNKIRPKESLTRAEFAAILARLNK